MMNFIDNVLFPFLIFTAGLLSSLVIIVILHLMFSEKTMLIKADWECTASHTEQSFFMAGKIMVPTTRTVCDRYERRKSPT